MHYWYIISEMTDELRLTARIARCCITHLGDFMYTNTYPIDVLHV